MEGDSTIADIDRVSTLRHDVMNPLTVVMGYAKQLYARSDLTPVCREYVGRIIVESERCVDIFDADKAARSGNSTEPGVIHDQYKGQGTQPSALLLVDDDEGILLLANEVLCDGLTGRYPEMEIVCARTTSEALEVAKGRHFDVFVVDLNIDKIGGGIDLLIAIDSFQSGVTAKSVLMSGGVMDQTTQRVLDQMTIPMLIKPFSINELVATVLQVLEAS